MFVKIKLYYDRRYRKAKEAALLKAAKYVAGSLTVSL